MIGKLPLRTGGSRGSTGAEISLSITRSNAKTTARAVATKETGEPEVRRPSSVAAAVASIGTLSAMIAKKSGRAIEENKCRGEDNGKLQEL